ncbi:MAG: hypothetical protein ACRD96_02460, partial [Bryobacteraceae bacterium]
MRLILAVSLCLCAAAQTLDLTRAVLVDRAASGKAAALLADEIERRSQIRLAAGAPADTQIILERTSGPAEGYQI